MKFGIQLGEYLSSAGKARGQTNLITLYGDTCFLCAVCVAHVPHNNHNFELISPRQSPPYRSHSPPRQFGQSISHRKVKYKYTTTRTRTRTTQHNTTRHDRHKQVALGRYKSLGKVLHKYLK